MSILSVDQACSLARQIWEDATNKSEVNMTKREAAERIISKEGIAHCSNCPLKKGCYKMTCSCREYAKQWLSDNPELNDGLKHGEKWQIIKVTTLPLERGSNFEPKEYIVGNHKTIYEKDSIVPVLVITEFEKVDIEKKEPSHDVDEKINAMKELKSAVLECIKPLVDSLIEIVNKIEAEK